MTIGTVTFFKASTGFALSWPEGGGNIRLFMSGFMKDRAIDAKSKCRAVENVPPVRTKTFAKRGG